MQDRSTAGYGIGVFPSLAVDLLGWGMLWSAKKFAYLQAEKQGIVVLEHKHTAHYPTINAIQQVAVA